MLVIVLLLYGASVVGVNLWFHASYPGFADRVNETYVARGKACFWIGLVNFVALLAVGGLLISLRVLALVGIVLWLLALLISIPALGASFRRLGERLIGDQYDGGPSRRLIAGGAVAWTAFLFPVVGWALFLYSLFRGFGAVSITLLHREIAQEEIVAVETEEPTDIAE